MANEDFSVGELSRGISALSEQIHRLHEETMNQHHRLRNELAVVMGKTERHEERLFAQGREIGALTESVKTIEADNKKLLWAIIGAYGAVVLGVIGVLIAKGL